MKAAVELIGPGVGRIVIRGFGGTYPYGSVAVPLDSRDPWARWIARLASDGDRGLYRDILRELDRAWVLDEIRPVERVWPGGER